MLPRSTAFLFAYKALAGLVYAPYIIVVIIVSIVAVSELGISIVIVSELGVIVEVSSRLVASSILIISARAIV